MYVQHDSCIDLYPSNAPVNFTVHLPKTLQLQGEWDVGLWEVKMRVKNKTAGRQDLYICCDAVVMTYVNARSMRLLSRLTVPQRYYEKQFMPVQYFMYDNSIMRNTIQLNIIPATSDGSSSLQIQQAEYTLHFKKRNSS